MTLAIYPAVAVAAKQLSGLLIGGGLQWSDVNSSDHDAASAGGKQLEYA
jgi:hypothetical protein